MEEYMDYQDNERFVIDDDGKAEWALRKVLEARQERDKMIEHYNKQIEIAKERCANTEAYMSELLRQYMETVPVKQTKTQSSYSLPSGTIRIKNQEPEYKMDEAELTKWLADNGYGEMVKTVYKPKWGDFKKLCDVQGNAVVLKETGEIVPCVEAVAREPKFVID